MSHAALCPVEDLGINVLASTELPDAGFSLKLRHSHAILSQLLHGKLMLPKQMRGDKEREELRTLGLLSTAPKQIQDVTAVLERSWHLLSLELSRPDLKVAST